MRRTIDTGLIPLTAVRRERGSVNDWPEFR
jgi:hypothetical protein